uniref:Uncharacterized protein n=1 Tax=Bradyrhizobium japonicum TaxID=375 RepID=Q8RLG8_BRAJP|nr:unknown [Bradyrhizobium japonicum]
MARSPAARSRAASASASTTDGTLTMPFSPKIIGQSDPARDPWRHDRRLPRDHGDHRGRTRARRRRAPQADRADHQLLALRPRARQLCQCLDRQAGPRIVAFERAPGRTMRTSRSPNCFGHFMLRPTPGNDEE